MKIRLLSSASARLLIPLAIATRRGVGYQDTPFIRAASGMFHERRTPRDEGRHAGGNQHGD